MPWLSVDTELLELDDEAPDLSPLAALLEAVERHRPAWQRDALCQEYPELPWFPERGQSTAEQKAICRRCLSRRECGTYALENNIQHGIWAGYSGRQLRRLQAKLDAA